MSDKEMQEKLAQAVVDGIYMGCEIERARIIKRIKAQICFDALADLEGRCLHHKGKCFELGLLVKELEENK